MPDTDSQSTPPLPPHSETHSAKTTSPKFHPMERAPSLGAILEALLKHPGALLYELNGDRRGAIITRLIALILICSCIYGVVMGSLTGGMQLWAAPVKLTAGLFFSVLLCLPSLYIFLCLNGADVRLGQICGTLLGMVALITLLLIGFAPVAWIFSQSTDSVVMMGMLHLVFWTIGLWFGVRLINGLLAYSNSPDNGHLKVWIVIFVLVSLQMTAVLRPLIGTAPTLLPTEKKFFVQHWFDNMNGQVKAR